METNNLSNIEYKPPFMELQILDLAKALSPTIYEFYRNDKISKDLGNEQIHSLVAKETYAQALAIWTEIDNELFKIKDHHR